jgi:AAA domain
MSDPALPQCFWDDEVTPSNRSGPDWIWHGVLARRTTTLLTGHGKLTGKTTLLSILMSRRALGGQLAGLAVRPGKTVIVSEEPRPLWDDRIRKYNFGGNVCLFPQPFLTVPTPPQWQALIDQILNLAGAHGCDLAVIDAIGSFLPCENNARSVYDALLPLRALTRANMGVALFHHPGKKDRPIGLAARGSTAFLGHVDISIDMRQPRGDPLTRRRHLHALSRFAETPRRLVVELNADATDYVPIDETAPDDFEPYYRAFRMVLEDAPQKLTRGDILAEWPADFDQPSGTTLKRWLGRAVERGIILCEGTGRKRDPYRYWLRETEAKWRDKLGPKLYDLLQEREREFGWTSLQDKQARDREDDTDSTDTDGPDDAV